MIAIKAIEEGMMLIGTLLASSVIFTGHMILAESKTDASKPSVVLAPTGPHHGHTPTLLFDASKFVSFDARSSGLTLATAWVPDADGAKSAYAITLDQGWEVQVQPGVASQANPAGTSKPKSRQRDWESLDYLPHLSDLSAKYKVLPQYVLPIQQTTSATWMEIGARFWLSGADEISGTAPDAQFVNYTWICEEPHSGDCKLKDPKRYTDRFKATFPGTGTVLIFDRAGQLAAKLDVDDDTTLWFFGSARLSGPPQAENYPLEHVRHSFDFIQEPSKHPTIVKNSGEAGGPVFCPAVVAAY